MIKLLLVFSFLTNTLFALDIESVKISDLKNADNFAIPSPEGFKAASQYVWMSVRNNPSWKEAEANDYSSRIEARVRENFKDSFDATIRTDMETTWANIRKSGSFYTMSASGIYLTMSGNENSYFINGNITEKGKTSFISVSISKRFDDFSYNVFGSGISLYTDRNSINGNYDPEKMPKKAVASIISMILAVQVEKGEPKAQTKAADNMNQRIWLTINPGFTAFNTVEARDPWARIEVSLRKIFDKEYDADLKVDNSRVWGRVSNFFTRRYELRAGRTNLRMEEWAGSWDITGDVEVELPETDRVYVNLKMNDRFNDGSFYIWENGIRLNIDRNSISGNIDTKIYPKEVIASISALIMSYYQINPNNPK